MSDTHHDIEEVDNRDPKTTWLHLDSGKYVEVDPIDLFINMLENHNSDGLFDVGEEVCRVLDAFEIEN